MDSIKLKNPNKSCGFIKVLQSEPINALMRARKLDYKNPKTDIYNLTRSFECGSERKVTVFLPPLDESSKFSETTKRLLGFLLLKYQETQSQIIEFSTKEYCDFCKLSNKDKAIKTLRQDLELLSRTSLKWIGSLAILDEVTGKRSKPSSPSEHRIALFKRNSLKKSSPYQISFSDSFYKMIPVLGFMYVPTPILQFSSQQHPHTFSLGWSLCSHWNINQAKKKRKYQCLKMESILKCAGTPSYQEEKKRSKGRHYKREIIEPVIKALDDLRNSCGLSYNYFHKDGQPISKEEEDQILNLDYPIQEFMKLKIYYSFPSMPQHIHKAKGKKKII